MVHFDVRTAFLIVGLLYMLLPIVTWFVLAQQRTAAVALWCSGGLFVAVAAILAGLQGMITEWGSIVLACLMTLMSAFVKIQALRLDLGCPLRWRWIVLATLALFLILVGIHWGLEDPLLRAQYFSVVVAGLTAHLAMLAWRIGKAEQSTSAHWIARVYILVVLALLIRLVELTGMSGDHVALAQLSYSSTLLSLSLLLSAVIGHFGYVGLALDRAMQRELKVVAERARAEESHRLGEQIAHLDRQRSLGEMSASLGHELNQPLTAILSNAQVAKRGLALERFDRAQLTDFLDKIIANTQRASQIIERIRDFIRPTATRCEPVDLVLVVHEVAALVADEARSHKVTLHLPPSHPTLRVTGDPIQLSQIVLNLLRNAIQALAQVVQREIHVDLVRHSNRIHLRVRDSGPGLVTAALTQAGTPFFTTKTDGLGMGLTISRGIAEQHGGTLTLRNSEDGTGALATLDLPALPSTSV